MADEVVVHEEEVGVHGKDDLPYLFQVDEAPKGVLIVALDLFQRPGPVHEGEEEGRGSRHDQRLVHDALGIPKHYHLFPLVHDRGSLNPA